MVVRCYGDMDGEHPGRCDKVVGAAGDVFSERMPGPCLSRVDADLGLGK